MTSTLSKNCSDLPVAHLSEFSPILLQVEEKQTASIKIAYLGGGSREWAVKIMGDLALSESLIGTLALYDIDYHAARHNEKMASEVFDHPKAKTRFHVRAEKHLVDALRGADFVIISIEPGPTLLRSIDLQIPERYGILQTVGDTTGPGGIVRALRSIPIFRHFARSIMEHCPQAWVINYTNPMTLCVSALKSEAPELKVFGCCHEVFGTQKILAELVADWFQVSAPPREEIVVDVAGVNHFTWATKVRWKGHDLMPRLKAHAAEPDFFRPRRKEAEKARANEEWFAHEALVAFDLLRKFGALGAAGDRHLVEFFPWYLKSEEELHRWGVVRTPYAWRLKRSQTLARPLGKITPDHLPPSGEEGVQQIEALLGLRELTTNVNLPNVGQMPDFPRGAVVETNAQFKHNAIVPLVAAGLEPGAASLVRRTIDEQKLVLQAAWQGDGGLALQALLLDPLVSLAVDDAASMLREMLEAVHSSFPESQLGPLLKSRF